MSSETKSIHKGEITVTVRKQFRFTPVQSQIRFKFTLFEPSQLFLLPFLHTCNKKSISVAVPLDMSAIKKLLYTS